MAAPTRIPFGLQIATGDIVSAHQVESGKACGCVCLSCNLPLIARKGTQLVWHFAHAPVDTQPNQITDLCQFSLFFSLRKMAQQELSRRAPVPGFKLPHYDIAASGASERVTNAYTVTLDSLSTDVKLGGVMIDVLAHVNGTPLGVGFISPEHHAPDTDDLERGRYGVIVIDLTPLEHIEHTAENPTEHLWTHITNDLVSKRWLYHPREQAARDKLERVMKERLEQQHAESLQRQAKKKSEEWEKKQQLKHQREQQRSPARETVTNTEIRQHPASNHRLFSCSGCGAWFVDRTSNKLPPCYRCGNNDTVHQGHRRIQTKDS